MMAKLKRTTVVCIHKMKVIMGVAVAAVTLTAVGGVRLGAPFSDGVVLQRGMKVPVWGTATVGATVAVSFAGQEKCATVGADGAWRVDLDPMAASTEERTMTVSERSGTQAVSTKTVARVLVGEVWMASGQSNMECPIWGRGTRYRDCNGGLLVQMTRLPLVRFVSVECKWSAEPVETHARWRKFDAAGLRDGRPLSAVAFYYARELYLALGIPIGIVNVSRGARTSTHGRRAADMRTATRPSGRRPSMSSRRLTHGQMQTSGGRLPIRISSRLCCGMAW